MVTVTIKKGYKQTEIGIIPEDWEILELKEVLNSIQLGGNYQNSENANGAPLIKMGNIGRGKISLHKVEYLKTENPEKKDILSYGDLLFNTRNTLDLVGKVAIWKNEISIAYYNSNLMRFKFRNNLVFSNFYANYLFNSKQSISQLKGFATGTTSVAAIYTRDLLKYKFVLPPKPEQIAIATTLSETDTLIDHLDKLITKKKAIKQGTMQQLLTGKKRLPGFSDKWEAKKISGFTFCLSGGTPNTNMTDYWGGNIKWMNSGELNDKKIFNVAGRITEKGLKESSTRTIPVNCVLVGLAGQGKTRGTVAINRIDLCINQSIAAILPSGSHNPDYLYYNLDYRYKELRSLSTGGEGRASLNLSIIKNIKIELPTKKEQEVISNLVSDMDKEIELLEQKRDKYIMLKNGMMQQLLTGTIRIYGNK